MIWSRMGWWEVSTMVFEREMQANRETDLGLPKWPVYGEEANSVVFNGYGSGVERDTYRGEAVGYIIDEVLRDGAM